MKNIFKNIVVKIITWEAKLVLKRYKPKIIAITGSVGKTSAKDAIYSVVASKYPTRKSQKSFNSEVGVPLTILDLPNAWSNPFKWIKNIFDGLLPIVFKYKYPQWLVLEVGADRPGDIEMISKWLRPDIAVMTRFGDVPVHVEYFPSIEDLVREKGFLAEGLKEDGIFIYNKDDEKIVKFAEMIFRKKISYGMKVGAEVEGSHMEVFYEPLGESGMEFPTGIIFRVNHAGSSIPVHVPGVLGCQHTYPLLSAFAVGTALGINPVAISESLTANVPPKGRMNLVEGIKSTLIIDDTYNSSPIAVHEGLNTLRNLKAVGKKIAVLGDMLELGQYSVDEHKKVGIEVKKSADFLVTVGVRSRATAESAEDAGMDENFILQFETSREAGKYMEQIIGPGDIIFVKGSQSMRMERIVEELMRYPENKEKLLVRQESEWQAKA